MGNIQLVAVHVEGNDQTIGEALKIVSAAIESNFAAPLSIVEAAPVLDPPPVTTIEVREAARAVVKQRNSKAARAGKAVRVRAAGAKAFCEECGHESGNARANGRHKAKMHGIVSPTAKYHGTKPARVYVCGQSGCFVEFVSEAKRAEHWERHGEKL